MERVFPRRSLPDESSALFPALFPWTQKLGITIRWSHSSLNCCKDRPETPQAFEELVRIACHAGIVKSTVLSLLNRRGPTMSSTCGYFSHFYIGHPVDQFIGLLNPCLTILPTWPPSSMASGPNRGLRIRRAGADL